MKFIVIQDTIINLKKITRVSKSTLTSLQFVSVNNESFYIRFETTEDRDDAYNDIVDALGSHLL
jgi:hypothetical protein